MEKRLIKKFWLFSVSFFVSLLFVFLFANAKVSKAGLVNLEDEPGGDPTQITGTFSKNSSTMANSTYSITVTLSGASIDNSYCKYAWDVTEPDTYTNTCEINESSQIVISGSASSYPGEGEFKLFVHLRNTSNDYTTISTSGTLAFQLRENDLPKASFTSSTTNKASKTHTVTVTLSDDDGIDKTYCKYAWATSTPAEFTNDCTINDDNTVTITGDETHPGSGTYKLYMEVKDTTGIITVLNTSTGFIFGDAVAVPFWQSNWFIITGGVVIIAAAVLITYLIIRKKKRKANPFYPV